MHEFLLRRTDGEWFDLPVDQFPKVLRPNSVPSEPIQGEGEHRILVRGCEVSFSYEDPGIQVCFETGEISEADTANIAKEILRNIEEATGQSGKVVPL